MTYGMQVLFLLSNVFWLLVVYHSVYHFILWSTDSTVSMSQRNMKLFLYPILYNAFIIISLCRDSHIFHFQAPTILSTSVAAFPLEGIH